MLSRFYPAAILPCLLMLFSPLVLCSVPVAVEKLQQPVWLQRNNKKISLYPGQALQSGDRVLTGSSGKVLLKLSEGSLVKLGVNADFKVNTINVQKQASETILQGAWQVLQGAFRFTTVQAKRLYQREVKIQVGTATIGVRGTDVWGKAGDEKDFIVLLEGKIDIEREGEAITVMDTPLTIYDAPRGEAAQPVVPVNQQKLQQWALETELDLRAGVISEQGSYVVYLLSTKYADKAQRRLQAFQQQGFAVSIEEAVVNEQTWYRLGVAGFVSYQDAQAFVAMAGKELQLPNAWIGKRR